MTTDNRACKNCTFYTGHKCTKGKFFFTDMFTNDGERIVTSPHRNSVCVQHQMCKGLPKALYIRPTTCATCFHFNPEPYFDFDSDMPAGCGEAMERDAGIDLLTGKQAYREAIASDSACPLFLTQQEGHLWETGHGDQFEERYMREALKQRFVLIQGGQA